MTFPLVVFFLSYTLLWPRTETASSQSCTEPLSLKAPVVPPHDLSWATYVGQLYQFPVETNIFLTSRGYYQQYCYHGGDLDSNTGCSKAMAGLPPQHAEAVQWKARNQCKIGTLCKPGGNCWGSSSKLCVSSQRLFNTWVSPKKMKWMNEPPWMMFAYHTCVTDWSCDFYETKIPVFAKFKSPDSPPKALSLNSKGEPFPLSMLSGVKGMPVDELTTAHAFDPLPSPKTKVVPIQCVVSSTKKKALCQLSIDAFGNNSSLIIEVDPSNRTGVLNNYGLKVTTQFHVTNASCAMVSRAGVAVEHPTHVSYMAKKLGSASSIDDVKELWSYVLFLSMESHYNLLEITRAVHQTQERLIQTVKSLAKIDDLLVGNLLNRPSSTKWVNSDTFQLCNEKTPPQNAQSNCAGSFLYSDGRYTKDSHGNSTCVYLNQTTRTEIDLFTKEIFMNNEIDLPFVLGASHDWEGWTWVANKKQEISDALLFYTQHGTSNSGLAYLSQQTFGQLAFWDWWYKVCSAMPWVSLILSLLAFLKRK